MVCNSFLRYSKIYGMVSAWSAGQYRDWDCSFKIIGHCIWKSNDSLITPNLRYQCIVCYVNSSVHYTVTRIIITPLFLKLCLKINCFSYHS